jgi:outer membrane protein assembly factor BamD (BamD/ComL family)
VKIFCFVLVFVLGHAGLHAAEAVLEPGVVELPSASNELPLWQQVEDARGSSGFAAALEAHLKAYPHGQQAARALVEQALLEDDLLKAAATLRLARGEGNGSAFGARAAFELARLEYAQDRLESAHGILEEADTWPRPEGLEPEWLYLRAQCRLVLKGFQRARDDFQHLVAAYPTHRRAEASLLGQADCEAALKDDERAWQHYQALTKSPFAAQALWGQAVMRQRQGRDDEARKLYKTLIQRYPASFEARAALDKVEALAKAKPRPVLKPTPTVNRWWVQVGAFSRKDSALKLAAKLKKRRYPVKVLGRKLDDRTLYLVKVGPYTVKSKVDAAARKLEAQDKLPQRVVQE